MSSYATTDVPRRQRRLFLEDWTARGDLGRDYACRSCGAGGGNFRLMRRTFTPAVDERASMLTLTLVADASGTHLASHAVPLSVG